MLADPAGRVLPSLLDTDIDNAGVLVSFVIGGLVSDVDSGALQGMAVTGLDSTAGSWQYSLDGGINWTAFGAVSTASATLLAADAQTRVRLVPLSLGQSAITFRAWDRSSGANGDTGVDTSVNGGASAFSAQAHALPLSVHGVNQSPQAEGATVGTDEDVRLVAQLGASDADGDPLAFSIVTPPGKGRVTLINAATGIYAYTPDADVHGLDSFSFKVNDGQVDSNVATVTVVITPVNDAPHANDASVVTQRDLAVPVTLVAVDAENDALTYRIDTLPGRGTLSGTAPELVYTPNAGLVGLDNFRFIANDGQSDSNAATVIVDVKDTSAGNNPPVAQNAAFTTDEEVTLAAQLGALDTDGDALTFTLVGAPAKGAVTIANASTGAFSYTPAQNATGADAFTFTANDGRVDSNLATVSVTIDPVNDPPTIAGTPPTVAQPGALYDFTPSADDVDGDGLVFDIVNQPLWASFDPASGRVFGTPDPGRRC